MPQHSHDAIAREVDDSIAQLKQFYAGRRRYCACDSHAAATPLIQLHTAQKVHYNENMPKKSLPVMNKRGTPVDA
jgi:hypothetical protein